MKPEKQIYCIQALDELGGVNISEAEAAWDDTRNILESASLSLNCGELCVVIGAVGSGKVTTKYWLHSKNNFSYFSITFHCLKWRHNYLIMLLYAYNCVFSSS